MYRERRVFDDDAVNEFVARQKRQMDLYLVHLSIMHIQAEEYSLSLTESSTAAGCNFACKPGAAVAVARRGGCSASFDVMNKYFGISQMPIAGSTYWNSVHGRTQGEASQDEEGLQTMRNLARNMAWMMKCFEAGKEKGILPPTAERTHMTNFIR